MLAHKQWKCTKLNGTINNVPALSFAYEYINNWAASAEAGFIPNDETLFLCLLPEEEQFGDPELVFEAVTKKSPSPLFSVTMSKPTTPLCDTKTNYHQPELTPHLHGNYSRVADPTASHQLFTDSLLAGVLSSKHIHQMRLPTAYVKSPSSLWRHQPRLNLPGSAGPPSSFNERTRRLPSQSHH